MSNVPTNLIPTRTTQLPEYTGSSTLGYMPYVIDGRTYKVQFANIAAVGAVPSTRVIATGDGLQGGGDLSQDRTIAIIPHGVGFSQLDFTGVVAGTYGGADTIPAVTIDATGRVTAIVDTPVVLANYVPASRTVSAGAGLTGGGQLNSNITLALNPSNATPQPLGAASAGIGLLAAREDHVHPAVDLTDTTETQGVLPLGRGGTGDALSPVVGAVIYADNDSLNQTTAGNAGQILTSAGGAGAPYWQTVTGTGTVTSVGLSGGTTGLTATSNTTNPITVAGTFTLGGTLVVANGGTGATNATDARTNLVAAKSGANSDITSMSGITGGISLVDNIDFDTTAVVAGAVGRLVWNDGDGTLDLGLKGGNVTLQIGQEEVQRSFNEAGVAIVEGNVVYVSGAQGNRIAVSIAQANTAATSLGTIGMATENIAIGAEGFITTQGLVRKLNTILDSEGNALAEGDLLYLSSTVPGGYTKIEPDTPQFHVFVGYVVRVHATVGSIFIRPNVYPSLDEVNGIKIVSTASGNTLIYDAVAGYYKTNTLTAGTNVSITNGPGTITINATDQFVGTVTSVSGTGTVNGITLTGTVTSSGSLTLGGTLSGVSLTTQVSGILPATNGGTGQASYAVGDLLYASTTTALSKLADVATGNALISGGVGVAPLYGKIGLTTHVSGTLPVANGGTNATATPTAGAVAYGTGTAYAFTTAGTAGQVLVSTGGTAPAFGGIDGGTF